jgi:hypothetical protein
LTAEDGVTRESRDSYGGHFRAMECDVLLRFLNSDFDICLVAYSNPN